MKNILIVGAHYDDVELGAGGTAAKLAKEGCNVYKLTLTNNVTNFKQLNIKVAYETSVAESARACEILGIKEITDFTPCECTKLTYSTELMQRIEALIYNLQIDTVFIHYDKDMQQDHVEASRLCQTAARHVDNILMYQSNGYIANEIFTPTYFVDVSDYIDKKRTALAQYGQEHNRNDSLFEMMVERNHCWGYSTHVAYAEGFHVLKMLQR